MQLYVFGREDFLAGIIRTPDVPFVTGTVIALSAFPIIGPPLTTFPVSSGNPPAASISSIVDVPILVKILQGFDSDVPVTVTTLSNSGLFFFFFS